jgi:hypothetical protein
MDQEMASYVALGLQIIEIEGNINYIFKILLVLYIWRRKGFQVALRCKFGMILAEGYLRYNQHTL